MDPAEYHNYQVGSSLCLSIDGSPQNAKPTFPWCSLDGMSDQVSSFSRSEPFIRSSINRTLVGAGLKQKSTLRRPLASLIPPHITHIPENVASFDPAHNAVRTDAGRSLEYNALVVAMGLQVKFGAIEGLPKALADSSSGVSSIYSYQTCDKTWEDIDALRAGRAIFTQPQGIIKCAGGQHCILLPRPLLTL